MARGGHKNPPLDTHSPIVMRSFLVNNVTFEEPTTSNDKPEIIVEPVTLVPQGCDVQEIIRQSLIRSHSALAHIRQPSRPLNQPLEFSNIREKLEGTGLLPSLLGKNTSNPTKTPIIGAGGSGIPPSPPDSSPSSSGGESLDEGNSSSGPSHPLTPPTPMENQKNPTRPWLDQDVMVVPRHQNPLPKHPEKWLPKFDLDSKQSVEYHIKKFMLAIRLRSVENEDVVCRLFP
jgi:hypothetical protein